MGGFGGPFSSTSDTRHRQTTLSGPNTASEGSLAAAVNVGRGGRVALPSSTVIDIGRLRVGRGGTLNLTLGTGTNRGSSAPLANAVHGMADAATAPGTSPVTGLPAVVTSFDPKNLLIPLGVALVLFALLWIVKRK